MTTPTRRPSRGPCLSLCSHHHLFAARRLSPAFSSSPAVLQAQVPAPSLPPATSSSVVIAAESHRPCALAPLCPFFQHPEYHTPSSPLPERVHGRFHQAAHRLGRRQHDGKTSSVLQAATSPRWCHRPPFKQRMRHHAPKPIHGGQLPVAHRLDPVQRDLAGST